MAKKGFNVIVGHYERWVWIAVPLCARCDRRHFWGAFIVPAAVVLGVVAGALATAARAADMISGQAQLYVIFAVLAWIVVFINFGRRQVDYRVLGVCGVTFDAETVTLRFRGEVPAAILQMPRPA